MLIVLQQTICRSHIAESKEETVDDVYLRVLDGETPENIDKNISPCVIPGTLVFFNSCHT